MGHHDNAGLILPPRIAPYPVVIIPILKKNQDNSALLEHVTKINTELQALGIRTKLDTREKISQGIKFNEYEEKGVPIRLVVGPRDMEEGVVEIHRRDIQSKDKGIPREGLANRIKDLLDEIQTALFNRAKQFRDESTFIATNIDEMGARLETQGGLARAAWNGDTKLENILKEKFKATIRCMPTERMLDLSSTPCILSGVISEKNMEILIAKAY